MRLQAILYTRQRQPSHETQMMQTTVHMALSNTERVRWAVPEPEMAWCAISRPFISISDTLQNSPVSVLATPLLAPKKHVKYHFAGRGMQTQTLPGNDQIAHYDNNLNQFAAIGSPHQTASKGSSHSALRYGNIFSCHLAGRKPRYRPTIISCVVGHADMAHVDRIARRVQKPKGLVSKIYSRRLDTQVTHQKGKHPNFLLLVRLTLIYGNIFFCFAQTQPWADSTHTVWSSILVSHYHNLAFNL